MKIDNNFINCTRSSDKMSKLNKELINFHVITTKVSSNYNKIVLSGSVFSETIFVFDSSVKMCADRKTIVRNLKKICNKTDDNFFYGVLKTKTPETP